MLQNICGLILSIHRQQSSYLRGLTMRKKTIAGITMMQQKNQWGDIFYTGQLDSISFEILKCLRSEYRNGHSEWDGRKYVKGFKAILTFSDGKRMARDHFDTLTQSVKDIIVTNEYRKGNK